MQYPTPTSSFDEIGSMHLHIDMGDHGAELKKILELLRRHTGFPSTLHRIAASAAGPQRQSEPDTYGLHTPSKDGRESFAYFSTALIPTRDDLRNVVPYVLGVLDGIDTPGIVVETEHVVGLVDADKSWRGIDVNSKPPVTKQEILLPSAYTLPIEVHHAFNIPTSVSMPTVVQVRDALVEAGLNLGGVFVFEREGECAFRTNEFMSLDGNLMEEIRAQRETMDEVLDRFNVPRDQRWTLVERVLGIWHTGTEKPPLIL